MNIILGIIKVIYKKINIESYRNYDIIVLRSKKVKVKQNQD